MVSSIWWKCWRLKLLEWLCVQLLCDIYSVYVQKQDIKYREIEVSLSCLMTAGLRKDIRCHAQPCSFLCLQIAMADIEPQVKWAVILVIADG